MLLQSCRVDFAEDTHPLSVGMGVLYHAVTQHVPPLRPTITAALCPFGAGQLIVSSYSDKPSVSVFFLLLEREIIASTALTRHHTAQILRSLKLPAIVNPNSIPRAYSTIIAMLPPFPPFLDATDTMPPDRSIIETITPADPDTSPLSSSVLYIPAAHD